MDYKTAGLGLGILSLAIAAGEVFAAKRITSGLGVEGSEGVVQAFGAREAAAGVALLAAPAVSSNVWMRVAGDVMDLGALGLAARRGGTRPFWWGALAFVGAATVIDVIVARGLDRTTGEMLPTRR